LEEDNSGIEIYMGVPVALVDFQAGPASLRFSGLKFFEYWDREDKFVSILTNNS
jgi:hypothetical protein